MTTIIGIKLPNRIETSAQFQDILSCFGCAIKTRLGIHHADNGECSNEGVILLEVILDDENLKSMTAELMKIDGLKLAYMQF